MGMILAAGTIVGLFLIYYAAKAAVILSSTRDYRVVGYLEYVLPLAVAVSTAALVALLLIAWALFLGAPVASTDRGSPVSLSKERQAGDSFL